jgi:hypothetical protein
MKMTTLVVAKLETKVIDIATKVRTGMEEAGTDAVKLAAWLGNNSAEITALAGLAGSGAAGVSALGLNLVKLAINVVKNAATAASSNGLSVPLDQETVTAVKALIAAIEKI